VASYSDEASIANAIMKSGPIETAFTVYSDFENYVSGVYKKTSSSVLVGHAVRIVGWGIDSGVKYWKVANSWNPFWGEKGYFRIVRGTDECGIESQGMADDGGSWSGPGL
jgi:cathepsin B